MATNYRKLRKMVLSASKKKIFLLFVFLKIRHFSENSLLNDVAVEIERLTWMSISR